MKVSQCPARFFLYVGIAVPALCFSQDENISVSGELFRQLSTSVQKIQDELVLIKKDVTQLQDGFLDLSETTTIFRYSLAALQGQLYSVDRSTAVLGDLLKIKVEIGDENKAIDVLQEAQDVLTYGVEDLAGRMQITEQSLTAVIDQVACQSSLTSALQTSTGVLQKNIDLLDTTKTGMLKSLVLQLQGCCDEIITSTGYIQQEMHALDARIAAHEHALDILQTSTGALGSTVEKVLNVIGAGSVVMVHETVFFDHQKLLKNEGDVLTFKFSQTSGEHIPQLVFDAKTVVHIPARARIVFDGEGVITISDQVQFVLHAHDSASAAHMIIQNRAHVTLAKNARATVSGKGHVLVRDAGALELDQPSNLIIGATENDDIRIRLTAFGTCALEHTKAAVSCAHGNQDLIVDDGGIVKLTEGQLELNVYRGKQVIGSMGTIIFKRNALLEGADGFIVLGDNKGDRKTTVSTRGWNLRGDCFLTYVPVATTLKMQDVTMQETVRIQDMVIKFCTIPQATDRPSIITQTKNGLAAWHPKHDASTVLLEHGDHNVWYGKENDIIGYNRLSKMFKITADGKRITY